MSVQHSPKTFLPELRRSAVDVFAPVHRELNRVLEDMSAGWNAVAHLEHAPRMDIVETKDAIELTVELPGMAQSDVRLEVEADVLIISGEKTAAKETKADAYRLAERTYGAFSREVRLPRSVDIERITASMADGVLKIRAPKTGDAGARAIAIKSGG